LPPDAAPGPPKATKDAASSATTAKTRTDLSLGTGITPLVDGTFLCIA
jgi:hypothetical protein